MKKETDHQIIECGEQCECGEPIAFAPFSDDFLIDGLSKMMGFPKGDSINDFPALKHINGMNAAVFALGDNGVIKQGDYIIGAIDRAILENDPASVKAMLKKIEEKPEHIQNDLSEIKIRLLDIDKENDLKTEDEKNKQVEVPNQDEKEKVVRSKASPKKAFLIKKKKLVSKMVRNGDSYATIQSALKRKYKTDISLGTISSFVVEFIKPKKEALSSVSVPEKTEEVVAQEEIAPPLSEIEFLHSIESEIDELISSGIGYKKLKTLIRAKYERVIAVGTLSAFAKKQGIKKKAKALNGDINKKTAQENQVRITKQKELDSENKLIADKRKEKQAEKAHLAASASKLPNIQTAVRKVSPPKEKIGHSVKVYANDEAKEEAFKKEFLGLVKKTIPEDTEIKLSEFKKELLKQDKFFSCFKYEAKTFLDLLKRYPDELQVSEVEGYTPPVHVAKLLLLDDGKDEYFQLKGMGISSPDEVVTKPIESIIDKNEPIKILKAKREISQPIQLIEPEEKKEEVEASADYISVEESHWNERRDDDDSLFKIHRNHHDYYAVFPQSGFTEIRNFAEYEMWEQTEHNSIRRHTKNGILRHYLNRTYSRLKQEDKIEYSADGKFACFNTGLLTGEKKDVFILFTRSNEKTRWAYAAVIDSYSMDLQHFDRVPEMVDFTNEYNDLLFDTDYSIEINMEHIVKENATRLPEMFANHPTLASHAIIGAVEELKLRLKRDYSLAVPSYYHGEIQLFLPIDLLGDGDLLVLVADKDVERKMYRIRTVLPLEVAYGNARVIKRLDGGWLQLKK